ncbi:MULTISPECIES: hypothetical protein [Vibrio]|uniref:DUF6892 domain-containing protein n=1 Tax=Vibrio rotiferianus TaxID=190895 RepID=A0A7Y3Z5E7_9VIBR|nr:MULTISPECIES: hypothetical protein [Vibrio]MDK9777958.1 hypothetical protein [Vibrio sp. D401a]MDK9805808.1 hypothetical protein [Vibrio sp. D406a]NOH46836.1 hypothetical protein [Vibrio rotiferianus]USD51195.1 hypothetical protein J4N37_06435 [Vibrio sp. SCSIO 43153]
MSKVMFEDFGFKLAVINHLMYDNELLTPIFNLENHIKKCRNLDDSEVHELFESEEGYAPFPEAIEFFKNIEIPQHLLENIDEIIMDGGDEIYSQIIPWWGGEDYYEIFGIKSAEDADMMKNLKEITLLDSENELIIDDFKRKGIEADWV